MTANRQEVLDSCPFTQYEFIAKDQLQYWPVADTKTVNPFELWHGQELFIIIFSSVIYFQFQPSRKIICIIYE